MKHKKMNARLDLLNITSVIVDDTTTIVPRRRPLLSTTTATTATTTTVTTATTATTTSTTTTTTATTATTATAAVCIPLVDVAILVFHSLLHLSRALRSFVQGVDSPGFGVGQQGFTSPGIGAMQNGQQGGQGGAQGFTPVQQKARHPRCVLSFSGHGLLPALEGLVSVACCMHCMPVVRGFNRDLFQMNGNFHIYPLKERPAAAMEGCFILSDGYCGFVGPF